ncbi:ATP-binding cassette domain-containing protein [Lutimaribacter sp. EGI FJ00015]|uniref:ATP-binding cassette domain-containing protein n=1 Tax=Lutimaribacter degradans TaxID=2945989 RepID=A0ACC5ZZU7_9RHOB|nr:ATP-binding cassette domain-containing protein [Lutimaribacter sp. EGI FJ00013]MCM2563695.1 ATP-binding cassette domain-containing protein [Lutimaribacter sp. EGI FJ00013]MCO0614879.1 ATP-binding cassette domain-containing protein [Lutimaribacter sp. EGI FJ00015]MCO0637547.1 ATP-binding cassette domain-containing protein [Lutimaribacter sp. EGI FJ00014]
MLRFDDVRIVQGDFTLRADMAVDAGARVAVIGPSGSGKSTLLNALAGFLPLAGGRIGWHGTDISLAAPALRPVAMLFQDNNLFPHLTVAQNVGLGLRPDLRLNSTERAQVDAALESVGLAGMGARRPGQLSGGQQGRAALARVLVQKKPMILLDEPFAALGPALKAEMLDLVSRVLDETGATLLMVSHDPGDARRICPQTIVVDAGRAEAPVDTITLLDNPPPGLRAYLGG